LKNKEKQRGYQEGIRVICRVDWMVLLAGFGRLKERESSLPSHGSRRDVS